MLCDSTLFTIGFIVNSGEEEVIADNYGDDEADDLGIGGKRKRLVRNKLAGYSLLIFNKSFILLFLNMICIVYLKAHRLAAAAKSIRPY